MPRGGGITRRLERLERVASMRALAGLPTEAQLQRQIVQGLALRGYAVLECGRAQRQARCPRCGQFFTPTTGTSNSIGTPDLLVADPRATPPIRWTGIELKRPTVRTTIGTVRGGRPSEEQAALAANGLTVICRSLEDVLAVLEED